MGVYATEKLPRNIFTRFAHYFRLNLDKTSLLCNEVELKVVGSKDKPHHVRNCGESRFSIAVLWVGSAAGVNGPVIFLLKGGNMHSKLRVNKLVTRNGFTEGSCVIPNKSSYMYDETWAKVVKVLAPGIIK